MSEKSIILVEVFTTPYCNRCQGARQLVETLVQELAIDYLQWREINIIEKIDYAVQLGIVATPAIAINGKLAFTSSPTKSKLKTIIQQTLNNKQK